MRFLKAFLAENTTLYVLPKLTEPISRDENTTQEETPEPPKPSSVSFGSTGTLGIHARTAGITVADVLRVFSLNRAPQLELVVSQATPCPVGPVVAASVFPIFGPPDRQIRSTVAAPVITIVDPAKFISTTLGELASFVSEKNSGRRPWIEDHLDEKIEQLRLCGVEAGVGTASGQDSKIKGDVTCL